MGVAELAAAVQKAGYRTNATTSFRTMVNIALIRNKKRFVKVERGVYTAR